MFSTRLKAHVPALVALFAAQACEQPAAPTRIDPAALTAATTQMTASLEAPVTRSLGALSQYLFRLRATGAGPVAPLLVPGRAAPMLGPRLLARLVPVAAALSTLPDSLRGRTLEYDCVSGTYGVTTRPGAPVGAVRFTLYTVGPNGVGITCPTNEIGQADFADTSVAGLVGVHVRATDQNGTAYADYVLAGATSTTGALSVTASGTVSDGTTPRDFTVALAVTTNGADFTGSADVTLGATSSDSRVTFHDDLEVQSGSGRENLDFSLHTGAETARLVGVNTISGYMSSLALSLTVNGTPFATITGTVPDPSFSGPDGKALAQDDLDAAQAVYHAPIEISSDLGGLLQPPEIVLGIGG